MKIFSLITASLLCLAVNAQIKFNTGSAELDKELNQINSEAKSDLTKFKQGLEDQFHVGVKEIDKVFGTITEPAEAHLAFKIGEITNKPMDVVLRSYTANKDKGWGAIAKDLGIKPGSAEFHALKGKSKGNSGSHGNGHGNGNGNGHGNGNGKKK